MFKIEKISFDDTSGLFIVVIDETCFSLSYQDLEELSLSEDKKLTEEEFLKIVDKSSYNKKFNLALNYAKKRFVSSYKVDEYLRQRGFKDNKIVIEGLINLGLVDDAAYLKAYIEDKLIIAKQSHKKILFDLCKKGFSRNEVLNVLEEFDKRLEIDNCFYWAEAVLKNSQNINKAYSHLERKGFSYDCILAAIKRLGY